jgi:lysophospholipase L1-like esterase
MARRARRALGPEFTVISEGLPGRTTVHDDTVEGGKRSGVEVLPAILPSHAPVDLMLLMLGTNDLKPRFSVTAAEIARSLERWSSKRETSCPSSVTC